jgi:ketosteroid isomerase-like protein
MFPDSELAIRLRRAAFNRALADADLAAIGSILAPGVILVAGTDSAVIAGRKAQLAAWKREFAARERAVYVRTPETVIVSPVAPIAFEHGAWQGVSSATGAIEASGSYTAKWRRTGTDWTIEAELYLTLA